MKSDKSFIPVLSTLCRRFWMSGLHVSRNLALLISLVINSSSLGTFLMAIKRARIRPDGRVSNNVQPYVPFRANTY